MDWIQCSMEKCEAKVRNSKWARLRAGSPTDGSEGWFFSKEDPKLNYCPDHLPDWVPAWRAKQAERKLLLSQSRYVLVEFETQEEARRFYEFVANSRAPQTVYKKIQFVVKEN